MNKGRFIDLISKSIHAVAVITLTIVAISLIYLIKGNDTCNLLTLIISMFCALLGVILTYYRDYVANNK